MFGIDAAWKPELIIKLCLVVNIKLMHTEDFPEIPARA